MAKAINLPIIMTPASTILSAHLYLLFPFKVVSLEPLTSSMFFISMIMATTMTPTSTALPKSSYSHLQFLDHNPY